MGLSPFFLSGLPASVSYGCVTLVVCSSVFLVALSCRVGAVCVCWVPLPHYGRLYCRVGAVCVCWVPLPHPVLAIYSPLLLILLVKVLWSHLVVSGPLPLSSPMSTPSESVAQHDAQSHPADGARPGPNPSIAHHDPANPNPTKNPSFPAATFSEALILGMSGQSPASSSFNTTRPPPPSAQGHPAAHEPATEGLPPSQPVSMRNLCLLG